MKQLKEDTEKYSGEEYKRHVESKLRNLKFRAGTKIREFLRELRSTIRDYYGLTTVEQIDQIGMNHILSTLEDSIREDAKILLLSGNVKTQNFLKGFPQYSQLQQLFIVFTIMIDCLS